MIGCSNSSDIKVEDGDGKDTIVDTFEEREAEINKYTTLLFEDSLNQKQRRKDQKLPCTLK